MEEEKWKKNKQTSKHCELYNEKRKMGCHGSDFNMTFSEYIYKEC